MVWHFVIPHQIGMDGVMVSGLQVITTRNILFFSLGTVSQQWLATMWWRPAVGV